MLVPSRALAIFSVPLFVGLSFIACDGDEPSAARSPTGRTDAGDDRAPSTAPSAVGDDTPKPCGLRPWAPPRRLAVAIAAVSSPLEKEAPTLTPDELSLVFQARSVDDAGARQELWAAKRESRTAAFSAPERLAGASSDADDAYPALTSDGVTLLFSSRRLDEAGPYRLFRAERPDITTSFSAATALVSPEAAAADWPTGSAIYPFLTPDRTALYFAADQGGDGFYRIYRSDRLDNGELGAPVREGSVDDATSSLAFVLSTDRLTMLVSRDVGGGRYLVHSAVRTSAEEPFNPLQPVDTLNSGATDTRVGWLSPDGCRTYLTRRSTPGNGQADGDVDVYESERQP